MITNKEYETFCELLKYPNPEGLHPVEARLRDMARVMYRQRYAEGCQEQQYSLMMQGLEPIGTYPADMEARSMFYGAKSGHVFDDSGKCHPFFGCNLKIEDPSGKATEIWTNDLDYPVHLPQKAGILSIWINEDNDAELWITCRNGEGEEFDCPWTWANPCERSEQ